VALAALVTIFAACEDPLLFIQERIPFEPPRPVFTLYWGSVVDCSGLEAGDYDRVSWFEIEAFPTGEDIRARWNTPHDITLRTDSRFDELVVKHEILHDLLNGDRDHAHAAWQACGLAIDPE
jgi:hypothetical protein